MRILLDTDSFLCMRKWSFLNLIVACRSVEIVMTEYAARYELSRIQDEVKKLEVSARLVVERVLARTPAHECYRLLLKAGADKGEAEAMSWAAAQDKKSRPVFVSIDKQARGRAKGLGLRAYDLMDFAVLSRLLRILRFHAHDLKLVPSVAVYKRLGKGPKQRLRFTKAGDPGLEEAYARHFVWPGKRPFHSLARCSADP